VEYKNHANCRIEVCCHSQDNHLIKEPNEIKTKREMKIPQLRDRESKRNHHGRRWE